MSTRRGTLAWLGAVVLTGAVVWMIERLLPADGGAPRVRRLFQANVDAIETLRIDSGELRITCERRDGTWWIVDPITARADDERIRTVLDTLALAPVHDAITVNEQRRRGVSQREYGLVPPRASLTVQGPSVPQTEIRIGAHAPHGQSLYAATSDSSTVWVSDPVLHAVLPASVTDLRDRTLLPHTSERLRRFELLIPDRPPIAVERDVAGRWWIRQPEPRRADEQAIAELLDYVSETRIQGFVRLDDPATGSEEPADVGISFGFTPDEAKAIARFWFAAGRGAPAFHEIVFGKSVTDHPELVYLHSTAERLVATVDRTLVQALRLSPDRIRDRRVWPFDLRSVSRLRFQGDAGMAELTPAPDLASGWALTAPVQAPAAAEVSALLAALVDLTDLSITDGPMAVRPMLRLEWSVGRPTSLVTALVARAEAEDPRDAADWLLHLPADGWTHRVAAGALPPDFGSMAFYASLRDPTILQFSAEELRRIEQVLGDGRRHEVVRQRDGGWTPVSRNGAAVDQDALAALLRHLNPLRAHRVAALAPLADNGLGGGDPVLTLTLTPSDPERNVRILHLARPTADEQGPAPAGGYVATLRGTDSVFMLTETTARILLQALVTPLP